MLDHASTPEGPAPAPAGAVSDPATPSAPVSRAPNEPTRPVRAAASPATASGPSEGCEAVVIWSEAERRLLMSLPEPSELVEAPGEPVWCALERGHQGAHWTLGQLSGEHDYWWLRWDDTGASREFVLRAICRRYAGPAEPGELDVPCVLPVGHLGAHSYTRPA